MSSVFGEAQILIRPNTAGFATALREQVALATKVPIVVPVALAPGAIATTAALSSAQKDAAVASLGLADASTVTNQAIARGAVILDAEALAAKEDAAALRLAGAEKVRAATASKVLTTQQTLAAAATQKLVFAQAEVEGSSSAVAAAQIGLTRSTAAVAAAQKALGAALEVKNIALIDAAALELRLAEGQHAEALTALEAARAQAEHAATLGAVGKAGVASAAGMLGLRGAVLTAGGAFIAAVAGIAIFKKSIEEASDLTEEINKTQVVFKASASAIDEWSKTTARAFGIARVEALRAAGQFGAILVPMGVLPRQAAIISQSLVELASDMASFNNVGTDRALEAIRAGLVGQSRPLRVLGVQLTAARVEQEAMRESGKKTSTELTQQEKILARYSLILQDAAIQMGDFARTQGRLANQSRILKAQIADLGGALGESLTPALTKEVQGLNIFIGSVGDAGRALGRAGIAAGHFIRSFGGVITVTEKSQSRFDKAFKDIAKGAELAALGPLALTAEIFGGKMEKVSLDAEDLGKRLGDLGEEARKVGGPAGVAFLADRLNQLITFLNQGGPAGRAFARSLAQILADLQLTGKIPVNLELVFQQAQSRAAVQKWWGIARDSIDRGIEGLSVTARIPVKVSLALDASSAVTAAFGTDAEQIASLKAQRNEARERLIRQLGLDPNATTAQILAASTPQAIKNAQKVKGFGEKRLAAITAAANDFASANSQIESVLGKQATAAEKHTSDVKQHAQDIQDARDKADQALQDAISTATGKADLRKTVAEGTKSTLDDLNALLHERAVIRQLIRAIVPRIKDEQLRAQVLAQLRAAEVQTTTEIKKLRDERKDARTAARQAAIEARQAHLEAMLSIAETTPGTRDDARALKRIISFDEARIAELKKIRHRTREENAQLDAYRVDLAQRTQALRELTAEKKKNNNASAAFQFEFLQTQAGFAANLLGNLIPGGATGGLVGGSTAASTSSISFSGGAGGTPIGSVSDLAISPFEHGRGQNVAQSVTAQSATMPSGPSRTGQARQTHLLNQILHVLNNIYRGTGHPEAHHRRRTNPSAMDLDNHH